MNYQYKSIGNPVEISMKYQWKSIGNPVGIQWNTNESPLEIQFKFDRNFNEMPM